MLLLYEDLLQNTWGNSAKNPVSTETVYKLKRKETNSKAKKHIKAIFFNNTTLYIEMLFFKSGKLAKI